jgi:hypothetical protein
VGLTYLTLDFKEKGHGGREWRERERERERDATVGFSEWVFLLTSRVPPSFGYKRILSISIEIDRSRSLVNQGVKLLKKIKILPLILKWINSSHFSWYGEDPFPCWFPIPFSAYQLIWFIYVFKVHLLSNSPTNVKACLPMPFNAFI